MFNMRIHFIAINRSVMHNLAIALHKNLHFTLLKLIMKRTVVLFLSAIL